MHTRESGSLDVVRVTVDIPQPMPSLSRAAASSALMSIKDAAASAEPATDLHLGTEAWRLRRHQARVQAPLHDRTSDRPHEGRVSPWPLLSHAWPEMSPSRSATTSDASSPG
jgi:hypothetical protein